MVEVTRRDLGTVSVGKGTTGLEETRRGRRRIRFCNSLGAGSLKVSASVQKGDRREYLAWAAEGVGCTMVLGR